MGSSGVRGLGDLMVEHEKIQKFEWRQFNQPIALLLNSMHPACTSKYEPQTAVEVMITVWRNCIHRLASLPQHVQPVSATTTVSTVSIHY